MSTLLLLILLSIAGIVVAWFLYFRFSHDSREFILLSTLTVAIIILILVALFMPSPRPPVVTTSAPLPTATAQVEATALPEVTDVPVEPTEAETATPTQAPTRTATTVTTPTIAVTASPTVGQPTATTVISSTPTTVEIISTVLSSAANIRSAPEQSGQIVGTVSQGDQLVILGETNDWYLVRLGVTRAASSNITTGQGWIAQALVNPPTQTVPAITPTPGS